MMENKQLSTLIAAIILILFLIVVETNLTKSLIEYILIMLLIWGFVPSKKQENKKNGKR